MIYILVGERAFLSSTCPRTQIPQSRKYPDAPLIIEKGSNQGHRQTAPDNRKGQQPKAQGNLKSREYHIRRRIQWRRRQRSPQRSGGRIRQGLRLGAVESRHHRRGWSPRRRALRRPTRCRASPPSSLFLGTLAPCSPLLSRYLVPFRSPRRAAAKPKGLYPGLGGMSSLISWAWLGCLTTMSPSAKPNMSGVFQANNNRSSHSKIKNVAHSKKKM